jgi:pimeloyl-ACP methyl ester carboxylesterase
MGSVVSTVIANVQLFLKMTKPSYHADPFHIKSVYYIQFNDNQLNKYMKGYMALLLFLFGCTSVGPQYGDNPSAGGYVSTRGIRFYYESYGQGDPLVMLHINGGSINVFTKQIPYFAEFYHVIALDTRAHGKSTDPLDSLTFEQMADDVNAVLDSLHLDSCYVLGWSDGGITGLLLALRHPSKVRKLAVSGPNLWPDTTGLQPFIWHWLEGVADSMHRLPQTPKVKNDLKIVELDLHEPHMTLEELHAIRCPTLVIGGDHDAIPPYHLWQIATNIPSSYLWIVPHSSHFVATDHSEAFNTVVHDFFEQPYERIEGMGMLK